MKRSNAGAATGDTHGNLQEPERQRAADGRVDLCGGWHGDFADAHREASGDMATDRTVLALATVRMEAFPDAQPPS